MNNFPAYSSVTFQLTIGLELQHKKMFPLPTILHYLRIKANFQKGN